MSRRWTVLAAAALAAAPVVASCSDDDDQEGPVEPTVTLFEETINPTVSVG
jgi:hypothetical protein